MPFEDGSFPCLLDCQANDVWGDSETSRRKRFQQRTDLRNEPSAFCELQQPHSANDMNPKLGGDTTSMAIIDDCSARAASRQADDLTLPGVQLRSQLDSSSHSGYRVALNDGHAWQLNDLPGIVQRHAAHELCDNHFRHQYPAKDFGQNLEQPETSQSDTRRRVDAGYWSRLFHEFSSRSTSAWSQLAQACCARSRVTTPLKLGVKSASRGSTRRDASTARLAQCVSSGNSPRNESRPRAMANKVTAIWRLGTSTRNAATNSSLPIRNPSRA